MSSNDVANPMPPAPPPAVSSGGASAVRVVLVVIATVAALSTLGCFGVLAFGLSSLRVVTDTQALPAGVRSLTIDSGGVPAVVRLTTDASTTEPRVDLRTVTRNDDAKPSVTNDAAGSRVTLSDSASGFGPWKGAAEINVVLPPGVARGLSVTVNQQRGSLTTDADLDQLVAKTDGDVALGGSARRVDVNVRRGDISTNAPIAVTESFTAVTESGNIVVEFRAAPRITEAVADGNVTVGLPGPGPYRVRAQSAKGPDGDTTVTVPATADPRANGVTARSERGNVTVTEVR